MTALATRAARGELVVADTRERVAKINALVHQVRSTTGGAADELVTSTRERIGVGVGVGVGVGDTIVTRRNDTESHVANRETWAVLDVDPSGVTIVGAAGQRVLPPEYVREHVELGYATTDGWTAPGRRAT